MANTIKIKRSSVSGKVPTTSQLELGELAVNTYDGKLYTKKDDGTAAIVEIGGVSSTADSLTTARTIALSGDVSGSTSFDGSANVTITATVADDSHNHVISNVDGLQTALDAKLPLAGGQLTGNITFSGAQTVDGRDLSVDGAKLDGIASGAQVNVATNLAQGTRTTTTVPVTSSTGTDATLTAATTSLAGVMTSADKSKLDGIASGATNVTNNNQLTNGAGYTTNTGTVTSIATSAPITGGTITGTGTIGISAATTLAAGSMSAADKSKLDGIASGATNVTNNNQLTNGAGYITSSGSITGNAATATTLQTARTIALGGDLSGSASFNGSANITITAAVADDSHNHVISNVDGLQTALDGKASATSPTFSGNVTMSGTGAIKVANGTTAQRPTGANGMVRYNTTLGALESYVQGAWQVIANTALDYGLITSASTTTFDYGALS